MEVGFRMSRDVEMMDLGSCKRESSMSSWWALIRSEALESTGERRTPRRVRTRAVLRPMPDAALASVLSCL